MGGKTGGMLAAEVGVDAISSASPMATAAGGASALEATKGAGGIAALASKASTGTTAIKAASSTASNTGFMDRVIANWDSYDKYFKFYNQVANYGYAFQQATQRRRGYYY